jgi:hypothetical protein
MIGTETIAEVVMLVIAVGSILLAQWRSAITTRTRIEVMADALSRLADQVERQNGYVRQHGEELAALRERLSVEESKTRTMRLENEGR